jgi:nucleotide-binding universal stress UspA family protein
MASMPYGPSRTSLSAGRAQTVDYDRRVVSMPDLEAVDVFERIVCGADGTPEGLVAVEQAARLADGGTLRIVTVADVGKATHAGMAAPHAAELMEKDAQDALAEARAVAPDGEAKVVHGDPVAVLLREAADATLVAVGSHGRGRAAGLVLGTVAARILRDVPCSVLIARAARERETWPASVVVGIDGSGASGAAFTTAKAVAETFDASLRAIASTSDQVDQDAARAITPELEVESGSAVDVLAAATESSDLLVLGSRGLHGLKALGSVSERAAYAASSSVLVVRSRHD